MPQPTTPRVKILLYDIETTPRIAFVWGHWETNVLEVIQESHVLCFAYKWLGEDKIHSVSLPNFRRSYQQDKTNDKEVCQALWDLFEEADIVCGHNSMEFDTKKSNSRFIFHGFHPPAPFKQVDTLKTARQHFAFPSNKLDDLGDYLEVGRKIPNTGKKLWLDVMEGKRQAWRDMIAYNKQDVELLERVYLKLRPWMSNHPNYNLMAGTTDCCPNCGRPSLIVRKYYDTLGGSRQQLQCTSCGHYCNRPFKKKDQIARQI